MYIYKAIYVEYSFTGELVLKSTWQSMRMVDTYNV